MRTRRGPNQRPAPARRRMVGPDSGPPSPSMTTARTSRPFLERLAALVLMFAFVLQSAAAAGEGCVARAFTGRCCCASSNAPAQSSSVTTRHSCCAPVDVAHDVRGPRFAPAGECHCSLAPLPPAPAAPQAATCGLERSAGEDGFAHWIAGAVARVPVVETDPPESARPWPPRARTAFSSAHRRLEKRGVLGHLSELCTFRS